jgi:DNA-binding PadR family transcriptional regulator
MYREYWCGPDWRRHAGHRRGFGGFGRGFGPFAAGFMGGRGGGAFRVGRMVADGDLRLIVLALLERNPRHGYDIIKAIEELTGGFYSPSPGVIYPTLTYLEETGHAASTAEGNKKVYSITDAGRSFLDENREGVEALINGLEALKAKMAQFRDWWDRDLAQRTSEDRDIPGVVAELNEARRALKAAIAEGIDGGAEEQRRIAEILKRAASEISGKSAGIPPDIDLG